MRLKGLGGGGGKSTWRATVIHIFLQLSYTMVKFLVLIRHSDIVSFVELWWIFLLHLRDLQFRYQPFTNLKAARDSPLNRKRNIKWERVFCAFVQCACPTRTVVVLQGSDNGHPLTCYQFNGIKCCCYLHRHPRMFILSVIQHDSKLVKEFVFLCHVCLHTLLSALKCLMGLSVLVCWNCPSRVTWQLLKLQ